ncbi:MAG: hypothetical protein ACTS44_01525 [Candidatus Hodgkinia cicadicola]
MKFSNAKLQIHLTSVRHSPTSDFRVLDFRSEVVNILSINRGGLRANYYNRLTSPMV